MLHFGFNVFYLLTEIAVALFFSQGTVPFHGFFIIKLN